MVKEEFCLFVSHYCVYPLNIFQLLSLLQKGNYWSFAYEPYREAHEVFKNA